MPKYYCDYCDTFLSNESVKNRKTHNKGKIHINNVKVHYQKWFENEAQKVVDATVRAYQSDRMHGAVPRTTLGMEGPPINGDSQMNKAITDTALGMEKQLKMNGSPENYGPTGYYGQAWRNGPSGQNESSGLYGTHGTPTMPPPSLFQSGPFGPPTMPIPSLFQSGPYGPPTMPIPSLFRSELYGLFGTPTMAPPILYRSGPSMGYQKRARKPPPLFCTKSSMGKDKSSGPRINEKLGEPAMQSCPQKEV